MNGNKVFIIAEAGVNHNGNFKMAKKMIHVAKSCGADAIKFQIYAAEDVVSSEAEMAPYQKKNVKKRITQLELLKQYELTSTQWQNLKKECDRIHIEFMATAHCESAIPLVTELVKRHKIASGDITNFNLINRLAKQGKQIILSTGMSTFDEVKNAVSWIRVQNNDNIVVMQCTSVYPCPPDQANLKVISKLKDYLQLPVGFSDHTRSLIAPSVAVALGATYIEKHFTLSRSLSGPDHLASLNPPELKSMINNIRATERLLGNYEKEPTYAELAIKKNKTE